MMKLSLLLNLNRGQIPSTVIKRKEEGEKELEEKENYIP